MKQIARNLTDVADGFLNAKRLLILDRDTKFSPMIGTSRMLASASCDVPTGHPTPMPTQSDSFDRSSPNASTG